MILVGITRGENRFRKKESMPSGGLSFLCNSVVSLDL